MNIVTKTALAAVLLAATVASASAQQGQTRQIQVLAAPGAAQAQPVADQGPVVDPKPEIAQVNPAPAPEIVAPKAEIAPAPGPVGPAVIVAKPEPKFVAPIIEKPARKAYGYSGYGYRAPHCH